MSLAEADPARARIVVADDSGLMRRFVGDMLARGGFEVVAEACDGDEALAACRRHRPDAMTLDLSMPGMGGIEVLRELRRTGLELPVVVVSAFSPAQGAYAVDALSEGAFELVTKPTGLGETAVFEESLLTRLRLAVNSRRRVSATPRISRPATRSAGSKLVLIAVSTGGPRALASLLPALPSPLGMGTLIVQHMPPGFTTSLAARLDRAGTLTVREATGSESLDPTVALLAPGGRHLRLGEDSRLTLSDEDPVGGLRPRADLLIEDAAQRFGRRLLLVVMTGMGDDGLRGARAVKRLGGRVIVESEETCTVYGMPRAVAEADLADRVVPLSGLASAIVSEAQR
jgi:two-component system chemotaxis response regulator CheB